VEKTMRFPFDIHGATETVQYPLETISSDQIHRLKSSSLIQRRSGNNSTVPYLKNNNI
jgi:hypothetical protein